MASLNWERFTQEAKLSLSNAQTLALQLKQVTITAEHLLYSLLEIPNCDAVQVLLSLNVDIPELKNKLQTHLQSLPTPPANELTPTLSDSLKNILQKAVLVFREQKFAHVNTLCLLLAFFHLPELPATQFLQQVNLPPEIVQAHVTHESVSRQKAKSTSNQMFDRFTNEVLIAAAFATTIAEKYAQNQITPEHLLLGLLNVPKCDATQTLLALHIDIEQLKQQISTHLQSISQVESEISPNLYSKEVKNLLETALKESLNQHHNMVNSRHVMLGYFHFPDLVATQLLLQAGISSERIKAQAILKQETINKLPQTFSTPTSKTERVSPVFIGLVFVFIILGYVNYTTLTTNGITVFLFVTVGWLISLALHEFAHAAVAYWAGDHNVKQKGYLTLNPLMYTDWLYSLVYPLLIMAVGGIGLPGAAVYINTHLIIGRFRKSLVSAAGPVASLVLTGLLAIPFWLNLPQQSPFHYPFWAGMALLAYLHITVVALCFLPIPGLDGFGIWQPYLPSNLKNITNSIHQYSFLLVIIVFFTPNPLQTGFWQLINWFAQQIHLDITLVQTGYQFFQFWENGF